MHKLTCGIEIHQQLDTEKLFCHCRSGLSDEEASGELHRQLRPTQSEMGEVDRAVLAQAERKMKFRYQVVRSHCCLVEADEEPPHDANAEAMRTALQVAAMLNCSFADEVHFMRKLVIDGSNTSGFQRTALVALDGSMDVGERKVGILSVCLEEDAARKVEAKGQEVTYRLDRLGIPLIEIATAPDMHDPEEVKEVALRIGSVLRATRKVRRGLGTIREDLNISIPGGARIEIKGAQDLALLPEYVRREMDRQTSLLEIVEELRRRGTKAPGSELTDISETLKDSKSKVISGALAKKGRIFAAPLPGYEGVMKGKEGRWRLGAEMAQYARTMGVAGIFHSDELPAYGITPEEVASIRKALSLGDSDGFALCADEARKAEAGLKAALRRAGMALQGVPEETRDPQPDGSSTYSRPLPGAGRMYPETDVRPIIISAALAAELRANLPELPEAKATRYAKEFGISEQQAKQIVREGHDEVIEAAASMNLAAVGARTLLNTVPELEREGCKVDDAMLISALRSLSQGAFAKEALPDVLRKMSTGCDVDKAVADLGLGKVDSSEAEAIVRKLVEERGDFVRSKGAAAVGPLMAPAMAELKGKLEGKAVSDLLKKEIERFLKG
jgi:glutamyl-tRNA(Gln) amidotransferase subunit E